MNLRVVVEKYSKEKSIEIVSVLDPNVGCFKDIGIKLATHET